MIIFLVSSEPKRYKEIKCTYKQDMKAERCLAWKRRFKEGWQEYDAQCIHTWVKLKKIKNI